MERDWPEIINLEIMSKCNLKCTHCKLQHQSTHAQDEFMSLEKFKICIDKIENFVKNAKEFMFSSVEPLIHPNLFEMMDYVASKNPNIEFPIQTNSMFLDGSVIEKMAVRNVPWISVSLDGAVEEKMSFFKVGTKSKIVVSNIRKLRERMPKDCTIRACFVSCTNNIDDLVNHIYFCKELGIDAVDVNGLFCFDKDHLQYALYSEEGNERVEQIYQDAKKAGEKLGIQVQVPLLKPKFIACEWNKSLLIDGDGNVNPCVMLAQKIPMHYLNSSTEGHIVRFGNIFEQDMEDIWNDERFVLFRENLKNHVLLDVCRSCAEGFGVVCSNR